MAGVRLNMKESRMRAVLGDQLVVTRHARFRTFVHRERKLVVTTVRFRVKTIYTDGRGQRGRLGVGVGTSERRLRRAYRRLRCETAEGVRTCAFGGFELGEVSTVFVIRRGRVASVTVGEAF